MIKRSKKFSAVLVSSVLCFTVLGACANTPESSETFTQSNAPISSEADASTEASTASQPSGSTTSDTSSDAQDQTPDTPSGAISDNSVGQFTTQDVNGKSYTQDIFKDYDLTMVNVFATWCSPCVAEMPDLEKLHQEVADKSVNVVGVVLDVLNEKGDIVEEDLDRAKLLVEQTGVTYPVLLPDMSYMNGHLTGIEAIPLTFFVDSNGNVVGESYCGSGGFEDWLAVVEQELANLKGGR